MLVAQLYLTLGNPVDYSPPGSSVHGILQARILEWVAIPSPGDLPDAGIEPGLLPCRQILYCLSRQGSPEEIGKMKNVVQTMFYFKIWKAQEVLDSKYQSGGSGFKCN